MSAVRKRKAKARPAATISPRTSANGIGFYWIGGDRPYIWIGGETCVGWIDDLRTARALHKLLERYIRARGKKP